jgi:hypothetical protein
MMRVAAALAGIFPANDFALAARSKRLGSKPNALLVE